MVPYTFEVTARSRAAMATVFDLVGDARRWPEWTWVRRAVITRQGDPPPNGIGSVRRLGIMPFASSEEIVAWEPPVHLAYVMRWGMPVRDYRADVRFAPGSNGAPGGSGGASSTAGGTTVTWSVSFRPLVPGTGALLRALLRAIVGSFARGVTRFADRMAAQS